MPEAFYSTLLPDGTQLIPGEYTNSAIHVTAPVRVCLMLYTIPPPAPAAPDPFAPHPFAPHKFTGRLDRILGANLVRPSVPAKQLRDVPG